MSSARAPTPFALLDPAQARQLFAYNERVFERYVRRVRRMPWKEVRRKREIGHQSLFDTLVHILNVHEVWVGYLLQGKDRDEELEALFHEPARHPKDWKGFAAYDRRVWGVVHDYLSEATAGDLRRRVHAFWMPGVYHASDGLWQSTFEQAHHLGEVIGALWQQDLEPPEMTWIRVTQLLHPRG